VSIKPNHSRPTTHIFNNMQGRPVRVLYDAYMHHGQNRGEEKHVNQVKNT